MHIYYPIMKLSFYSFPSLFPSSYGVVRLPLDNLACHYRRYLAIVPSWASFHHIHCLSISLEQLLLVSLLVTTIWLSCSSYNININNSDSDSDSDNNNITIVYDNSVI